VHVKTSHGVGSVFDVFASSDQSRPLVC